MKKDFIEILLDLLKEKDLSQRDLANGLKIGEGVVSRWLSGKAEPTNKSIGKLAKFFNVPVTYFLDDKKFNKSSTSNDINEKIDFIMHLIEKQDKVIEEMNKRFQIENEMLKKEIKLLKKN